MHATGLAAQARARPHTIGLNLPLTGHSPVASSCSSTPKDQLSEANEQRPPARFQHQCCRWLSSCRDIDMLTKQHFRCCVRLRSSRARQLCWQLEQHTQQRQQLTYVPLAPSSMRWEQLDSTIASPVSASLALLSSSSNTCRGEAW